MNLLLGRSLNASGGTDLELPSSFYPESGNHTFEYVGFGPGNYSTGLPSVQVVLTEEEVLLAQSQKEEGGIAFYSGLNSGDLFIGNTRISSVTGEEES